MNAVDSIADAIVNVFLFWSTINMPYVLYAPTLKKTQTPLHVLNRERSVTTSGNMDFIETGNHRWTSADPRLLDSPRDQRLSLDSPPPVSTGTQPLSADPPDRDRVHTGFYDGGYETIYPGSRVYSMETSVSRNHARIWHETGTGYVVEDLGSSNGTFVNGQRVSKCILNNGDVILVGVHTLDVIAEPRKGIDLFVKIARHFLLSIEYLLSIYY